jgi:hypothetical protein
MRTLFCDNNPLAKIHESSESSDITLSDFSLFGKVKCELIDHLIVNDNSLLTETVAFSEGISRDELNRVFQDWIERIGNVIDSGEESGCQ